LCLMFVMCCVGSGLCDELTTHLAASATSWPRIQKSHTRRVWVNCEAG
jgi:hypothetical protein